MKYFTILFIAIVAFSCSQSQVSSTEFSPKETININDYDSLDMLDIGVMYPIEMALYDDRYIIILDDNANSLIKVYDTKSKQVNAFGLEGRGPEEFGEIGSIFVDNKGALYVNEISSKFIGKYNSVLQASPKMEKLWNENKDIISIISIDDKFVCSAVFDTTALYLIDDNGITIDKLNSYPMAPPKSSILSHSMAAIGRLATNSTSNYFARSTSFYGGIDFFSIEDEKITHEWNFKLFDMEYDIMTDLGGIPTPNESTRNGYGMLSMSDKYLYAPYSGRGFYEPNSNKYNLIHVFDFHGNHTAQINLPFYANQVIVNSEGNFAYASYINSDGATYILSFKLPQL